MRRARASTSVVMRLDRTHASASASDAGDGGGAGMVAAVEAALDPVVRRGQDPLRLVELCIGCAVVQWCKCVGSVAISHVSIRAAALQYRYLLFVRTHPPPSQRCGSYFIWYFYQRYTK